MEESLNIKSCLEDLTLEALIKAQEDISLRIQAKHRLEFSEKLRKLADLIDQNSSSEDIRLAFKALLDIDAAARIIPSKNASDSEVLIPGYGYLTAY